MTKSDLQALAVEIEARAKAQGLSFDPVIFEVVDWEQMAMLASYMGFPRRYPHWRWGSEYLRFKETYRYGLSKIYELVVNTKPVYAYLLDSNPPLAHKLVIAHVYGHADFFKENLYFAPAPKSMHDELANHAALVEKFMERHGVRPVEEFLDLALSLENLIDPHSLFVQRAKGVKEPDGTPLRMPVRAYLEPYVNPPAAPPKEAEEAALNEPIPPQPERDVLAFLIKYAPLASWQKAILEIIREESYYFAPQGQTKVMNEGWATYWHTALMNGGLLEPGEVLDFAELQAGVLGGRGFNPYKIGYTLMKHIEERWRKGRFGPEYEAAELVDKLEWQGQSGDARAKLFQIRRVYSDISFLEEFFTPEFALEQRIVLPEELEHFHQAKQRLLFMLTNAGNPIVYLTDANYKNRGELYLEQAFEGAELDLRKARAVIENLYRLWGRPVHLETVLDDKPMRLSYDGAHRQEAA